MKHVVLRRFGLDGGRRRRSRKSGTDLGITRERVRQLETRALRELRNVAPGCRSTCRPEPALDSAQLERGSLHLVDVARRFSASTSICRTRSRVSPSRWPISSSVFGSASASP